MSQRNYLAARASTVERGLLSAKISSILDRSPGSPLTDEDRSQLGQASDLLSDLLSGAETLKKRACTGGVTARSIHSLGFALTPLEELRRVSNAGDPSDDLVVRMLGDMAAVVDGTLTSGTVGPASAPELQQTRDFFGFLADSSLSALNKARRRSRGSSFAR